MKRFCFIIVVLTVLLTECLMGISNAEENAKSSNATTPDPEYNGKPLSYWLTHLYHYVGNAWTIDHDSETAVLQIGSNAVPMLSSWITKPEGGGWGQPDHAVEAFQLLG